MKQLKKRTYAALLTALALSCAILAGCGQKTGMQASSAEETKTMSAEAETPAAKAPETEASGKEASEADTQKTGAGMREITDMAGRTMEIPVSIDKIFSTGAVAAIYLYTIDPDRLLGWNYDLNDLEKKIILPKYHDIPSYGMGDSVNYEAVIAAAPQIALDVSSGNDASKSAADKLSKSLGIPVVTVSNKLEDTAAVYRFLGELLGEQERGEALGAFADKTFKEVSDTVIPEDKKVTIYYGNGENSLETAPRGSSHAQIIDMVHAINVADMEVEGGSRVQISAEQLLAWDPDYIIVNGEPKKNLSGDAAAQEVIKNPNFATLKAVQKGQVFGTPNTPFSWVDRPPGPNRLIGIRWLAKRLYPDQYSYDIDSEVREFYNLFYHVDLTDAQMAEVMKE